MEKVEKVVKNNFFHDLGLQNGLRSWKKLVLTTFSTIFMIPKTSSEIRGKSGKSCQKQLFPRFGPPKRLESWKKLVLTTFSTISMIPKTSSTIRGKSGKSCQKQLFPRFGPPKRLEVVEKVGFDNFFHHFYDSKDVLRNSWKKWKKLSKTTFSTIWASKTA